MREGRKESYRDDQIVAVVLKVFIKCGEFTLGRMGNLLTLIHDLLKLIHNGLKS